MCLERDLILQYIFGIVIQFIQMLVVTPGGNMRHTWWIDRSIHKYSILYNYTKVFIHIEYKYYLIKLYNTKIMMRLQQDPNITNNIIALISNSVSVLVSKLFI